MCASALPGKNGTHKIGAETNGKRKNTINIIDCKSKKDDRILVVFGTSILDGNVHQMTV